MTYFIESASIWRINAPFYHILYHSEALDEKMIEDRKAADTLAQNGFTGKSGNPQRRKG